MNFLAHAYLSFKHQDILVGNMISDFVKGKRKFDYTPQIQQGITLHREIDAFTDEHEATREAAAFFKPVYRLYGGAFVDVIYDHFLARDEHIFPGQHLKQFAADTYTSLERYTSVFPEVFAAIFPYMKQQDWLFNYQYRWAIKNSFNNLAHRAKYMEDASTAFLLFEEHYETFKLCYKHFIPEVTNMVQNKLKEMQL